MSDLTIRNCVFGVKCTAQWDDLEDTDDFSVKFCQYCQKEIYYCSDDEELVKSVRLNRCVAIDKYGTGNLILGTIICDE